MIGLEWTRFLPCHVKYSQILSQCDILKRQPESYLKYHATDVLGMQMQLSLLQIAIHNSL